MSPISRGHLLPPTRRTLSTTATGPSLRWQTLALDREIQPARHYTLDRHRVITSHDAFRYFGRPQHRLHAPVGLSTESDPSAARSRAGSPDAGQDPGAVCGKHHRPTSRAATAREAGRHRRHALLGLAFRPDRPGANLSRRVPPRERNRQSVH